MTNEQIRKNQIKTYVLQKYWSPPRSNTGFAWKWFLKQREEEKQGPFGLEEHLDVIRQWERLIEELSQHKFWFLSKKFPRHWKKHL